MKRGFICFLICSLLVTIVSAQKRSKFPSANTTSKFGIFMNTLSLLEPQQAAIGAGLTYKLASRWDLSLELYYLFEGFWQGGDDYTSKGSRYIFTIKRFAKRHIFFYGMDARLKYFSFVDKQHFINESSMDTLFNFSHDANNILVGLAGIVGLRLPISKNKKWAFEINTGIGTKYRVVNRKNIPAGYKYYRHEVSRHYEFNTGQDVDSSDNVYFPSAIRVMYFF